MGIKFYESPESLTEDIQQFENYIKAYREGTLHPTKFKGIRVAFGVYEQRKRDTYMVRIRCSAGGITPLQLLKAAELGEEFGSGHVHVTTRQEIQLHYVKLEDVPHVMRELQKVGLSTRGGGGNTVRNIMASYDSGIAQDEVFDVEPYAIALTTRLIAESDSWNLPRKYKLTLSSSSKDTANATLQDLGFIAKYNEGEPGFEVWVAGGMGGIPRTGNLLFDWVPVSELYPVVKAIKNLFHKYGDRKNKSRNRLRFLWEDLTEYGFRRRYTEEREALGNGAELNLTLPEVKNSGNLTGWISKEVPEEKEKAYLHWKKRYVTPQKQEGLYSVKVSLILGDINTKDTAALARLLEPIGDNVLRCSMDQNIHLRNIPEGYLSNVFLTLEEMTNLYEKPKVYSNMIACTGADTCKLGICLPRGVTPAIQKLFDNTDEIDLDRLHDLKIHISGCPNSCGQHHVGDIGLFGRIKRKNNRAFPAYSIIGGAVVKPGETRFGIEAGWVHSRDIPAALKEILIAYEKVMDNYSTFAEYFDKEGKETIAAIAQKYEDNIPDFGDDKNYYFDWGADEVFSTKGLGKGECSAGMFDMIDVDRRSITTHKTDMKGAKTPDEKQNFLKEISFHTARMLLITRGADPKSEKEVYELFLHHFIDKNLIDEQYRDLIQRCIKGDFSSLTEKEVYALSDEVIKLYGKMDRSMKFPGETENMAIDTSVAADPSVKEESQEETTLFKDLRGVACPMNFVKTKMELSKIQSGETLKILLDEGAPIENVPGSVRGEGHKILSEEKEENHWVVLIEKV